jgi:hypothetical protein
MAKLGNQPTNLSAPIAAKRNAKALSVELLHDLATTAREFESGYKGRKSEFTYERLLLGLLKGHGFQVQRQVPARYQGRVGRIDLRIGGKKSGAFVELSVSTKQLKHNKPELHKLTQKVGFFRILILVNKTSHAMSVEKIKDEFADIPESKGRLRIRLPVKVMYVGPVHAKARKRRASVFKWPVRVES